MDQFRRDGSYSTIVLATANAAAAEQVAQRLNDSRILSLEAQPEPEYYVQQATQTESLRSAGITVAIFMGIGPCSG